MARVSLYLDEHVQIGLAEALKARGVDVLTTQEAGNVGVSDLEQLTILPKFDTKDPEGLGAFMARGEGTDGREG